MTDSAENASSWVWSAGLAAGYLLVLWGNPARVALRDGFRCALRYPAISRTLAMLGFAFAVTEEALRYLTSQSSEQESFYTWWNGWSPPPLGESALPALLPSFEATTGIFNCMITGFPVSIVAAVLLWFNWCGSFVILRDSLKRHYPRTGLLLLTLLLAGSACAALKPAIYLGYEPLLRALPAASTVQAIDIVRRVAFLFEHTFAIYIQISLIAIAYIWVRGMTYDIASIREFSIRRLGVVMRWAFPIYLLAVLFIELPGLLFGQMAPGTEQTARVLLGTVVLLFPAFQIRLIFHNQTVRECFREQACFWKLHRGRFLWLVCVAFLTFYGLAYLDQTMQSALGRSSAAGIGWNIFYPFLWAPFGAWMLSSWVCLFKQTEKSKPGVEDWIAF